jgi:hypothetical protein
MSKSKMLICFFNIRSIFHFEFLHEWNTFNQRCWEGLVMPWMQARNVVERFLIGSSPRQCAGTFFTSSVAVFSRKRAIPSWIICTLPTCLQLPSDCF